MFTLIRWFDALKAIEGLTNISVALTAELLNTLFFAWITIEKIRQQPKAYQTWCFSDPAVFDC